MFETEPSGKQEKLTPWVVGIFAVILIAYGMYSSFGSNLFHHSQVDISAASRVTTNAE